MRYVEFYKRQKFLCGGFSPFTVCVGNFLLSKSASAADVDPRSVKKTFLPLSASQKRIKFSCRMHPGCSHFENNAPVSSFVHRALPLILMEEGIFLPRIVSLEQGKPKALLLRVDQSIFP
jgi:hypothetical protein